MTPRPSHEHRWTLRVVLLAVAVGLVLMHHLVGAHQHTPAAPAAGTGTSVAVHHAPDPGDPRPAVAGSGTAPLHVHHDGGGHGVADLLHACLAVLAAAAALFFARALVTRLGLEHPRSGGSADRPSGDRSPPPGVPLRLARLQVLRL